MLRSRPQSRTHPQHVLAMLLLYAGLVLTLVLMSARAVGGSL